MKRLKYMPAPFIIIFTISLNLAASDTSDAEMLRAKCEKENRVLEISVLNFGDQADMAKFKDGQNKLKDAKLKIARSEFKAAIEIYNVYLNQQKELYTSLAKKYIDATKKLNDEVTAEMIEFSDDSKVDSYFKLAYRNLEDARTAMLRNYPVQVIEACRRSKEFSLGVYTLKNRAIPDKYKIDAADNKGMTGK